ncbi:CHAT domain-containing protein [Streptomyces sp. NPDC058001]|uniref:CHAT domain-containing protein n=1 Tax=Streptomyces sp. NPDC058001 TaxID=3346300 RepID=UPI0036E03B37
MRATRRPGPGSGGDVSRKAGLGAPGSVWGPRSSRLVSGKGRSSPSPGPQSGSPRQSRPAVRSRGGRAAAGDLGQQLHRSRHQFRRQERVLARLADRWDLIHFAGHGTFDRQDSWNSALHLTADPQIDSQRVTASDLLEVRLPQSTVVVLSACSSAPTGGGPLSDAAGLVGALLRIGARGIAASRRPVYDRTVLAFMKLFHSAVRQGTPAQTAAREPRTGCGLNEVWRTGPPSATSARHDRGKHAVTDRREVELVIYTSDDDGLMRSSTGSKPWTPNDLTGAVLRTP